MDLTVTPFHQGPITVLHVRGEIDLSTAPALGQALDEQVAAGRNHLVVDLEEVGFLESTGLGVLLERLRQVRDRGGDLEIVSSHPRILTLFTITALDKVFTIHESVEAATSTPAAG